MSCCVWFFVRNHHRQLMYLGGPPNPYVHSSCCTLRRAPSTVFQAEFFHRQCMYRDLYWAHSGRKCTSNPRHPCKYHSVREGRSLIFNESRSDERQKLPSEPSTRLLKAAAPPKPFGARRQLNRSCPLSSHSHFACGSSSAGMRHSCTA